jgi:hypothetical protein
MEPASDPFLEPGVAVRHPAVADSWLGRVRSVAGRRVTVNLKKAGKRVVDAGQVRLVFVGGDPRAAR